jgi:hypothetical protein
MAMPRGIAASVVTLTVRSVIPGRGRQPASPESISQDCGYGFRARAHSKSAYADLDIKVPISGKPEIGARPGMT